MYDLEHFTLRQMTECGKVLRTLHQQADSMEDVSRLMVRHLYDELRTGGERATVLVRAYKTHPLLELEPELQEFARGVATADLPDHTKCLTLLASAGVEPEWNSRRSSRDHRAIPLTTPEAVARLPMVAQLVTQLGVEVNSLLEAKESLIVDMQQKTFNVFYVPDAASSPHIPVQSGFVDRYGIRSVVGFGSMLPDGELFAMILFACVPVPREVAELFRPLAVAAKLSVLPFVNARIFEAPQHV